MNHNNFTLFIGLLISASYAHAEGIKQRSENNMQACVLYGTNERSSFPIPMQGCVDISIDVSCDEKVVDSQNNTRIWRSYTGLDCSNPNIKTGLSERYLLEGIE